MLIKPAKRSEKIYTIIAIKDSVVTLKNDLWYFPLFKILSALYICSHNMTFAKPWAKVIFDIDKW